MAPLKVGWAWAVTPGRNASPSHHSFLSWQDIGDIEKEDEWQTGLKTKESHIRVTCFPSVSLKPMFPICLPWSMLLPSNYLVREILCMSSALWIKVSMWYFSQQLYLLYYVFSKRIYYLAYSTNNKCCCKIASLGLQKFCTGNSFVINCWRDIKSFFWT